MSIAERKERQRGERHQLIVSAARELAEAEGWEAVTTRRLAELIHYSQPVLYSHFKGKSEIMAAVATRGFEELASRLVEATAEGTGTPETLRKACAAYLDFARSSPVVYEAMFVLPTQMKFASAESPPALAIAFEQLVAALGPQAQAPARLAEVLWSTLHGLVVLAQSGRVPADCGDDRLDVLVERFWSGAGGDKASVAASEKRPRARTG